MCGIFAYSGDTDCREKLVNGLKILEYRGYDSAGLV
jgi:glucosamine--fructose-6-phosphate aminotransferase (isomerizing)